ncbi:MAG: GHKL domain-containing protein [Lachnospiraceae bacterium]|nr:GHKL domain-containing protein [Lachnospiraceae bacterium]
MTYGDVSSPAMLMLFVGALLWMIMDIHFEDLTPARKWVAPLAILFLMVFNEALRAQLGMTTVRKVFLLTMQLPYFLLFLYLTKCGPFKMLFTIFSAMVFSSPPTIALRFVSRFVPADSLTAYLCMAAIYLATLLLVHFFFRRGFNYLLKYGDNKVFLPLFLVDILYYIYIFAFRSFGLSGFNTVSGMLIHYVPALQVFLYYFSLVRNYQDLSEKRDLETTQTALNLELDAAEEQIALLNEAQSQSAIYRHDMRHHLMAINGFLAEKDFRQAEAYIQKVCDDIEAVTPRRFCKNRLLDLLCSSFAKRAEQKGIRLTVEAGLPETVSLSDTEVCAMISNGLENAFNCVAELDKSRRWVRFYCGARLDKLLIEIKNPYSGEILFRDGLPISGQEGHGYGCNSIRTIADRNRGICVFQPEDGIFTLRIVIPM